jgi:CDP-4-dehydro-6-deoxyglucose reductase, E1
MIPLMKSAFYKEKETKDALSRFILETPRLSMDRKCFEFEKKFAKFQQRKHAILFNSGGSANLALLQSLRNIGLLKSGENVGFSSLTWSTNVMPIIQMGLKPVPVDCEPETLNVSSNTLNMVIDSIELKALFITNALGFTGDLEKIREICEKKGIILIEDNCESLGSELPSGKSGNFGLASTFSFYVAHHMSTIEGGMVCTDDSTLSQMLRIVRANGWDRNLETDQQSQLRKQNNIISEFDAKYAFYDLGYNLRPTEITGFLGVFQLQFIEQIISMREKNYKLLEGEAKKNPDLISINYSHMTRLSNFAYPVICKNSNLKNKYITKFTNAGVEVRPIIAGNIQRQPFYSKYVKEKHELPGAEFLHNCGFYFGNYPELSNENLKILKYCLEHQVP